MLRAAHRVNVEYKQKPDRAVDKYGNPEPAMPLVNGTLPLN